MTDFLEKRLNIGIIGTGISGLGIAYFLSPYHNIKIWHGSKSSIFSEH